MLAGDSRDKVIRDKLAATKRLHEEFVAEAKTVIPPEPEAYQRYLKEFLVEACAITKLVRDGGYNISAWGTADDQRLRKLMADRRNDYVYGREPIASVRMEKVPFPATGSESTRNQIGCSKRRRCRSFLLASYR
jgi:hypothetical protein